MSQSFIILIQYLDALDKKFYNVLKRYSDGTFVLYITNYKVAAFSKMYNYNTEGFLKAIKEAQEFINQPQNNEYDERKRPTESN